MKQNPNSEVDHSTEFYRRIRQREYVYKNQFGRVYIDVRTGKSSPTRTMAIDSSEFADFLRLKHERFYKEIPKQATIDACIKQLTAYARRKGPTHEVFIRVGRQGDAVYIDRAGDGRQTKISRQGVQTLKRSPCKFRFPEFAMPLPVPDIEHASIEPLWTLINLPGLPHRVLLQVWLIKAMLPGAPCPLLVLYGPKGAGKSKAQDYIKRLLDPSKLKLRALPTTLIEMAIAGSNCHIPDYANLTKLSKAQQDQLCRMSTGGTHPKRKNYSDDVECANPMMNPVILNGVQPFVTAEDLLDRCLILALPKISGTTREPEESLESRFEKAYPQMFGWVVDTLQKVLSVIDSIERPPRLPRMADYCMVGLAVEKALGWPSNTFRDAYRAARRLGYASSLASNPLALAVKQLVYKGLTDPKGNTFSELADLLREIHPDCDLKPKGVSEGLKGIKEGLRYCYGITFKRMPRSSRGYLIRFSRKTRKRLRRHAKRR